MSMQYNPEQSNFAQEQHLEPSLGRPVASEWMHDFIKNFRRKLPPSSHLRPRRLPGVSYVSTDDWVALRAKNGLGFQDLATHAKIMRLSDDLIERGILEEASARNSVKLRLTRLSLHKKNRALTIEAALTDVSNGFYADGVLIAGEKANARSTIGAVDRTPAKVGVITPVIIRLGLVAGSNATMISPELLTEIRQTLDPSVELLAVGAVDPRV